MNKDKRLISMFFISTVFFFVFHYLIKGWDFCAYALNARYWLGVENYFELLRAPLMPFLMLIFGAGTFAEYMYIILVSCLYLYVCCRFSRTTKIDKVLFYLFMLNPFVLYFGLLEGTELLSLSLLILGISFVLENKQAGHWFGLGFLTRYTNLYYMPILFFSKKKNWEYVKHMLINFAIFMIPIIPWLFYNYITTGNMFTSIADSYANNIKFRDYIPIVYHLEYILLVGNYLVPFFVIGLFRKIRSKKYSAVDYIMVFLLCMNVYNFIFIPLKSPRYLFNITLPIAYYSVIFFKQIKLRKIKLRTILIYFMIILMIFTISYSHFKNEFGTRRAESIENVIDTLELQECAIMTDQWVYVNYICDYDVLPPGQIEFIDRFLDEGYIMIYEQDIDHPQKMSEIYGLSIIGNSTGCRSNSKERYDKSYLEGLQLIVKYRFNKTYDIDACNIIFENKEILKNTCNLINLR